MVRNHNLAKSISDAGWGIFTHQLHYKAEYAGSVIHNSDRFYPSSKLCNKCGSKQNMPLHKRTFQCQCCGNVEDRDSNASKNLLNDALHSINTNTVGTTEFQACGDDTATFGQSKASIVNESGSHVLKSPQ